MTLEEKAEKYATESGYTKGSPDFWIVAQAYIAGVKELEEENRQLKEQIEKMKCCANCDHYRWSNGEDWCNDHYGQPVYDEECKGKWKLRE